MDATIRHEIDLPPQPHCTLPARLAALAHPARLAIVMELAGRRRCCCKDVVDGMSLAQSTVSQHLKVLVEAGIVSVQPDRQRSLYRLEKDALRRLAADLGALAEHCER